MTGTKSKRPAPRRPSAQPRSTTAAEGGGASIPDLISWVCCFALLAVPLAYAPSLFYVYPVPKMLLLRLSIAACLVLLAFLLVQGRKTLTLRWPTLLLVLFLVWMLVADLLGEWPASSFFGFAPQFEGWLGLAGYATFYVVGEVLEERQLRRLAVAMATAGALVGLLALLDAARVFHPWAQGAFGDRAVSTEGNPLFLGAFLAVALPVSLGLALAPGSMRRRLLFGLAFLLQLGGLYFSFGRGAWLGGAVGIAVVLALMGRSSLGGLSRWRVVLVSGVVAVAFIAALVALQPAAARSGFERLRATFDLSQGSSSTRLHMWEDAVRLTGERPLIGWGQDTYAAVSPRIRTAEFVRLKDFVRYQDRPHNQVLYVAYAGGIPAALLYVGLFGCALAFGFRAWANQKLPHTRLLIAVALATVAAHVVEVFFSYDLPDTAFPAYIALGVLARFSPAVPLSVPAVARHSWRDRATRYVLPAICVAGALLFVALAIRLTWADTAYVRGEKDPSRAVQHFARAVSLAPLDAAYALALGKAHEVDAATNPGALSLAARTYADAQGRMPWDPGLQSALGELYQTTAQSDLAEEVYRTRLGWDPLDDLTLFNYAVLLVQQRRGAQAIPLLTRFLAVTTTPDAEAFYLLGAAFEEQGSREQALAAYTEAQRIDPGNTSIAEAIRRLGD